MGFMADSGDAKEGGGGFVLIPEGIRDVEIVEVSEKYTKAGDPMVNVKMQVVGGEYSGLPLFDNIVIPNIGSPSFKIMGRTMHFLHTIGEPYEGKFMVSSNKWIGKSVTVKIKHEIQNQGKYAGQKMAKVSEYILAADVVKDDSDLF